MVTGTDAGRAQVPARARWKSPFEDKWFERPHQDERFTTRIDVADFQYARSESLRAHATQVDPSEGWWFALADAELTALYPWEDWILARSIVGPIPDGLAESDLFAGVRERAPSDRR